MISFRRWRLLPLQEASGTTQMSIDRALFEACDRGVQPPTLRFYTWKPIAISLGYHQRKYPPFWEQLTWHGEAIDLVRRPTGGRAVLHQGDLTYMVVIPGLSGTRSQTYQKICSFLISGWQSLGVDLDYGQGKRGYIGEASCFGSATAADLVTAGGYKFIGSAQYRRGRTILQHGAIALNRDRELYQQVFGESPIASPPPLQWSIEEIVEALTDAARDCFEVEFTVQPPPPIEN